MKFYEENIRSGRSYYLKACIYLLIDLENIPNVLIPGNSDKSERMKELAEEEECANTTTLL